MYRILYYLLLKPLSLLPMSVLFGVSDVLFGLMKLGFAYRKKVVVENLKKAFPNKTAEELSEIQWLFYQHFCDLLVESIKLFSITEAEATARFKVVNPEIFEELAQQGKSVILTGGHYQNWEMFAVATNPQIRHLLLGIYTPLSNAFMERKFSASRTKFGLVLVPKKEVKNYFETYIQDLTVTTFAIDQSPRKSQRVYWTKFMGVETAVHFGAEKYAKVYNYAVVYGSAIKPKRGFYELKFELLEMNPDETPEGYITDLCTKKLEQQILAAPQYWLWTHHRWKLQKSVS